MNRQVISGEEIRSERDLQSRIEARGLKIFEHVRGEPPRVFSPRNLTGQLMHWSMRDERLKTQLFRFIDVLPSLSTPSQVAEHAQEYLNDRDLSELPATIEWVIKVGPRFPWLASFLARQSVAQMAKTFILASSGEKAIPRLQKLRKQSLAFTADLLGEAVVSDTEAAAYQARYFELIDSLAAAASHWPTRRQVDCSDRGEIPKVNISVKISALGSPIIPADPEGAIDRLSRRLRPLLQRALERGVFINFDMEHTMLKALTIELFTRLLSETGLRDYPHFGIALQAYLRESETDFERILEWAKANDRRVTIRLIKGAYWDYETIMAGQRGWPVPVYSEKWETDAAFERLSRRMLENPRWIDCAFGTHNIRSVAACLAHAEDLERPINSFEFQMLYGMAEPIKRALISMGYRVREYCPIGDMLPGMSYLVRRLLENTSNEGFLRSTFAENVDPRTLLRDPNESVTQNETETNTVSIHQSDSSLADAGTTRQQSNVLHFPGKTKSALMSAAANQVSCFANEPLTDFTIADNRERMRSTLRKVRGELGGRFPLLVGGKAIWTDKEIVSLNPAQPSEIIGRVSKAGVPEAEAAISAARMAFPRWARSSVAERSRCLDLLAELLSTERFDLAALEVFETGKIWSEADADVAEAIDFCRFYAQEMRRLAEVRYAVPGEVSVHHFVPRGVVAVIAPWNFPLAILCGMTVAALVTGNCVIMKPSEQSSVLAARLMQLMQRAGIPAGAVNFLPGSGEKIGAYLVEHPGVDVIAFTGSREVGLKIWEAAGRTKPGQAHLKKAICEMGGKNAVIVDSDADLDEVIPAVVHSAFGYQGQKCSALSRLIVLPDIHDRLLERLIAATRDLRIGPPEDPGTLVGPVIDQAAFERIHSYIEIGKQETSVAFQSDVQESDGYFVPPTIFTNVPLQARIAQEEIFGPVLCILKARDLDEAVKWANSTQYALTGGLFSRSPANIERVSTEFEVGNLYINRGITGALVARQPFGGFKMSGGGTKAGGRDYLLNFMFPRVVTENVMRRGFAPDPILDSRRGE